MGRAAFPPIIVKHSIPKPEASYLNFTNNLNNNPIVRHLWHQSSDEATLLLGGGLSPKKKETWVGGKKEREKSASGCVEWLV